MESGNVKVRNVVFTILENFKNESSTTDLNVERPDTSSDNLKIYLAKVFDTF